MASFLGRVRAGPFGWAAALAILLGFGACSPDDGARAAGPRWKSDRLVPLPDGRRINLHCRGRGSPTVVFESGFGASGAAWSTIQPKIAQVTRACAYDRAGYGFSDPGPLPRDGAAIARDLDQALQAAHVEGPYVMVGHSAGGLYIQLFAARRPGEVAGLVMLDPTVAQIAPEPGRDGLDGIRQRLDRCLAATETSPPSGFEDPRWKGCVPRWDGGRDAALARRTAELQNQRSELDQIFGRTSQQVLRLDDLNARVPAYVFTASDTAASAPTVGYDHPRSVWELRHISLALGFRPGFQRTIWSSHRVMVDRPEVATEAILVMVKAARAGAPPPPLAPSETEPPPGDEAAPFPATPGLPN